MSDEKQAPTVNPPEPLAPLPPGDLELLQKLHETCARLQAQISRVVLGQDAVVRTLLAAIFAEGHVLIVGVPGLAKTLLVKTLAQVLGWRWNRIQFTPDLMPADIIGMELLQADVLGDRHMRFVPGPVFANIILADEINRTPPKTQSALLEAMQEYHVTSMGHSHPIEKPFIVVATQNPIEQEGTYPLPEAQLDRFMFLIHVDYPNAAEELRIARETTVGEPVPLTPVLAGQEIMHLQQVVRRVPVPDHVYDHVVKLVRLSRPATEGAPEWIKRWVLWGAGPRAVQYLVLGAKARAVLSGSYLARVEDVEAVAEAVLAHRILVNFHAESEGVSSREIIRRLLAACREP